MPQPLEFRKHVVGWVGGREGVLARTREMLTTTHPLTRAGDARKIDADSARRHAVDVVLAATMALVEPHLAKHVDEHAAAAFLEYEVNEGYMPTGADLDALLVTALDGEVLAALDATGVKKCLAQRDGDTTIGEAVAIAICAVPVGDRAKSLAFLGVTVDDIEALAAESRGLRASATVEVVNADPWDEDTSLGVITGTPPILDEDADPWDDDTADPWDAPAADSHIAKLENRQDPREITDPAPRQRKGDAPTAPLQGETPLATACIAALDALCKKSSATEEDVGRAVGVSRAMMNKYRYRKTAWAPTSEQVSNLRTMLLEFYQLFGNMLGGINEPGP